MLLVAFYDVINTFVVDAFSNMWHSYIINYDTKLHENTVSPSEED